jgi:hypothetical protein
MEILPAGLVILEVSLFSVIDKMLAENDLNVSLLIKSMISLFGAP